MQFTVHNKDTTE